MSISQDKAIQKKKTTDEGKFLKHLESVPVLVGSKEAVRPIDSLESG